MADTTYVDCQDPPILAAWLNDVNIAIYRALGNAGVAPTTAAQVLQNLSSAGAIQNLAIQALAGVALQVAGVNGSNAPYPVKIVGSTNPVPGTGSSLSFQAYQAALQVLNAAANQNWYFGVNDADANNLWIGAGFGPAQGLTAALRVTVAGLMAQVNLDNSGVYYEIGPRGFPQNPQNGNYAFVASDRGKAVTQALSGATNTVNASIFNAGDVFILDNFSAGSQTIVQGTSVTLKLAGTATTGTRTVAANGFATVRCLVGGATPTFSVYGPGVT